jgi:para-aminobenzoate synthetase component 1
MPEDIKFSTPLVSGDTASSSQNQKIELKKSPVSFSYYKNAFDLAQENIRLGNSYLLNLTFPTSVETDASLEEIFRISTAKYKLLYKNEFVVFSPETFVRIAGGIISSNPMKGTIQGSVPDAENTILNDEKEMAEHNTITDLIRNDLSIVAENVTVRRFRYVERIRSGDGELLQVSSEITGTLGKDYRSRLGEIITGMLPAGSVTGAPKRETVRIIKECEKYDRGWYTGIFGVFDGKDLDSAVMIRYIENNSGKLTFKSGGGITSLSDARKEYDELIAKVNIPIG